jgi:hypothetical protein
MALKTGVKEMVNLAKLALQDLARKDIAQEVQKACFYSKLMRNSLLLCVPTLEDSPKTPF